MSWIRPFVFSLSTLGLVACGSSRSGGLFNGNDSDAGPDAALSEAGSSTQTGAMPDGGASSDTTAPTSGNTTDGTTGVNTSASSDTTADASADTTGADTTGADTTGANTTGADTTGADTTGADTTGADTTGADTTGADTTGADTTGATSIDDGGLTSCTVSFSAALLEPGPSDDNDSNCANGLQVDLVLASDAPDQTPAALLVNGTQVATANVSNGELTFADVNLADATTVAVNVDGACTDTAAVVATCPVAPTCEISYPIDDLLNGELAPDGDRTSDQISSPFQTRFEVTTSVANGQFVVLTVENGETLASQAQNGKAVFPQVELTPDGSYTVSAVCPGDVDGESAPVTVTIDTEAPEIDVQSATPVAGQHFSPGDDVVPSTEILDFPVCVPVVSSDALDLTGAEANNVCVTLAGGSPICQTATTDGISSGVDGVCIPVTCPGSAPFTVAMSVTDAAGNVATNQVGGVTCASTTPTVEIIGLQDNEAAPSDVSRRFLASSDEDPNTAGAQYSLQACSNGSVGATAELFAGQNGSTLTLLETTTLVADSGAACPSGLSTIAVFPQVTLPASITSSGTLVSYTGLRVDVTEPSTEVGSSAQLNIWVDSTVPTISVLVPNNLCGRTFATPDEQYPVNVTLSASNFPVTGIVEHGGMVDSTYTFTGATPVSVTFPQGVSTFRATTTEPSGNVGTLANCTVTVNNVPTVVWANPAPTIVTLAGVGVSGATVLADADAGTPGWQGSLSVDVSPAAGLSLDGSTLQFKVNGANVGSAFTLIDNGPTAQTVTLSDVTIDDGAAVTVSAAVTGNGGTLTETRTLKVDTTVPAQPSALMVTQVDRRNSSVTLSWTASADTDIAGYDVAYLRLDQGDTTTVIDDANFDTATAVTGVTAASESVLIENLTIERYYQFALRAYDSAGNRGQIVATTTPYRAQLQSVFIPSADGPGTFWGYSVDASTDLTGDGTADLVVGSKSVNRVYIYFGSVGGQYAATPDVTIIGPGYSEFGASVAVVGNITGDSREDLVVAASADGTVGYYGRVYVVSGRAWTTGMTVDLSVSTPDPTVDFPSSTPQPYQVARVGDFNGDGFFDFAIHAPAYSPNGACDGYDNCEGALIVVYGPMPSSVSIPTDSGAFLAYTPATVPFYGSDWLLGITDLSGSRSGILAGEAITGAERLVTLPQGGSLTVAELGPFTDSFLGRYPAALVGSGRLAVPFTAGRTGSTAGNVEVYSLSATNMFAGAHATLAGGGNASRFGQVVIGARYSGRPDSYNLPFFGTDALQPALIVGGARYEDKLPKLYLLKGSTVAGLSTSVTTQLSNTPVADAEYFLRDVPGVPAAWTSTSLNWRGGIGFPVRDMNGDGFADIGVAEYSADPYQLGQGGIIILY